MPCKIDPHALKRVWMIAWRAAANHKGLPTKAPNIRRVKTRKGLNSPYVHPLRSYRGTVWINARHDMRVHATMWFFYLTGLTRLPEDKKDLFDCISTDKFPLAPKPKKRERAEPVRAEVIQDLRDRVAEWEQKRKDAQRSLKLAKTKLRGYRASLRGHLRELKKSDGTEAIGYNENQFAAHMRERLSKGE